MNETQWKRGARTLDCSLGYLRDPNFFCAASCCAASWPSVFVAVSACAFALAVSRSWPVICCKLCSSRGTPGSWVSVGAGSIALVLAASAHLVTTPVSVFISLVSSVPRLLAFTWRFCCDFFGGSCEVAFASLSSACELL